jgi:hypothetical protein
MRCLRSGVALEAEACLLEQFAGHGEIPLRVTQHAVSKVDRQVRKKPLDVLALAVPGDEANNREGVAEVMQARLESSTVRARNACLFTKPLEDKFRSLTHDGSSLDGYEKRSRLGAESLRPLAFDVAAQYAAKIVANRDKAALEELGLTDGKDACACIEVRQREMKRLADPEACSIEKQ